jgi:hypothetical protein
VVICKKWHVGQRLAARIGADTGISALGYLFDDENVALPDLGGIENRLDKRGRHRRAFLRLLFDRLATDRLAICVDPGRLDLIRDFCGDRAEVRLLAVDCAMDDAWLEGHARRAGLVGAASPPAALAGLLPTLRLDLAEERRRLSEAGLAGLEELRQGAPAAENALPLARFLGISEAEALPVAADPELFDE